MKAYKVFRNTDHYGYHCVEDVKYFFDKKQAEKIWEKGKYYSQVTRITTVYPDGHSEERFAGSSWYEDYLKNAKENQKVELIDEERSTYTIEEIEII